MKAIFSIIFCILFLTGFTVSEEKKIRVTCKLFAHRTEYRLGQVPELRVEIQNRSNKEIYLPGCLDGSAVKARFPYCYFSIIKPVPDTVWQVGCGFVNPLFQRNFMQLRPGEILDPHDERSKHEFFADRIIRDPMTFKNPGVYKIRFHYSTNAENDSTFIYQGTSWRNNDSAVLLLPLLSKMPKVDLVSNEITIRIVE